MFNVSAFSIALLAASKFKQSHSSNYLQVSCLHLMTDKCAQYFNSKASLALFAVIQLRQHDFGCEMFGNSLTDFFELDTWIAVDSPGD